jgi:Protein of unknown function (DUF3501)
LKASVAASRSYKKSEIHMPALKPSDLMTLEAYHKYIKTAKPEIIAHKRLRTVHVGEHFTLLFEDEQTIRYQVQEMLRIEKIFDEEGIQSELDAYNPLIPDGGNWKATMLIEYADVNERQRELARLVGVEHRMFVDVEGHARVYANADEDLERSTEEKTAAVHFLRFEFGAAQRAALLAGASATLGCDHTNYPMHVEVNAETLANLVKDVRA